MRFATSVTSHNKEMSSYLLEVKCKLLHSMPYFDIDLSVHTPTENHTGNCQDTMASLWKRLVSNALLK